MVHWALSLNNAVSACRDRFAEWDFQILHITGKGKTVLDENGEPLSAPNYRQIEFSNGMQDVYAGADLFAGAAPVRPR